MKKSLNNHESHKTSSMGTATLDEYLIVDVSTPLSIFFIHSIT